MRTVVLAIALCVAGSSCTVTRAIALPPVRPLALGPPSATSFALTELSWTPPSGDAVAAHDFSGVVAAAKAHARDVLTQSEAVGAAKASSEAPQYAVEIAITHGEAVAPNGVVLASLAAYTGLTVGAGAALFVAPPVSAALAVGALGTVVASNFLPSQTYAGTLTAEVRVRRAADGVEIARRTCTVAWKEPLSAASWREGWANSLGAHVGELEMEIGKTLRDVFLRDGPKELHAEAG